MSQLLGICWTSLEVSVEDDIPIVFGWCEKVGDLPSPVRWGGPKMGVPQVIQSGPWLGAHICVAIVTTWGSQHIWHYMKAWHWGPPKYVRKHLYVDWTRKSMRFAQGDFRDIPHHLGNSFGFFFMFGGSYSSPRESWCFWTRIMVMFQLNKRISARNIN